MLKQIFVIIYPPYNITSQGRRHEMASQRPCSFNLFAHQQTLRFYWNCTEVLSQSLGFLWVNPLGGFDKGISYIISSLSFSLAMLAGPCAAHMVCIVTPSIWAYPPMFLWFAIQSGCTYTPRTMSWSQFFNSLLRACPCSGATSSISSTKTIEERGKCMRAVPQIYQNLNSWTATK